MTTLCTAAPTETADDHHERSHLEGVLAGYVDRPELTRQLRCTDRTIHRYENQPDGLPCLIVGGRKYYRIDAVKAWLAKREQRRNPRRRS